MLINGSQLNIYLTYTCYQKWNYICIDCEQCFLFILAACIEALIENNTLVKFKQDMLQYTSLYMINNTLYDIYFDMRISV